MKIQEVARRAEVSTATVSRTINNPSMVDPETAKRVWKAIEELRYYPNSLARSLVSGRSRIFGLIVSDITNPFFPEVIKGLEDVAIQNNYEILVSSTNYDSARMALCVRRMLERKVEGVAIMTSEMDKQLVEQLAHRKVPMVFLDVGPSGEGITHIVVDYAMGVNEAVEHLLSLGHRRIDFISGPLNLKSARIRRSAFLRSLSRYGIDQDICWVGEGDHTVDGGLRAMTHMLESNRSPTAVMASNDLTAIGMMRAVRRAGRSVPHDISIVGFDDIRLAEFTEPPLTTVRLSRKELAEHAFDALIRGQDGRLKATADYRLQTHLVIRESTCQVNSDPGKPRTPQSTPPLIE
ncbi:MAG TPA: LacI family DNA-binding transcriptional regulator [Bryobacteraceae bacterium]|nr:LacI family DNA-binding transcriptional regulator [Bryobacteraceae bacterium]